MTDTDIDNMSAFSCGVDELDRFFHFEVKDCVRRHYLAAYCVYIDSGEIIAAFTLMNDALMITSHTEREDFIDDLRWEADEDIVDFLSRQSLYPAINIGHIGVKQKYQDYGVGSMVIDLVTDTYSKHRQSGCQFITVDALNNDRTLKFYIKNSFGFQTNSDMTSLTRRMYKIL